jgi:anaerobic selenocysteine-containing dehydrogenase
MGGNVIRACALPPAATGNIGKPGAGFCYLNGSDRKGIRESYMAAPQLRRAPTRGLSHMDLAAMLECAEEACALFCWNINIAASNPQQRLGRARRRDDLFTAAVDLFQTDTADFADFAFRHQAASSKSPRHTPRFGAFSRRRSPDAAAAKRADGTRPR